MTSGTDTINSVQAALVSASVGQNTDSTLDWMIYKWAMQDSDPAAVGKTVADRAICIYEAAGPAPDEPFTEDYPSIQVVVRSAPDDYALARQKIHDVFVNLHGQETAIGTAFVYFYAAQSGPIPMGIDQRRRIKFAMNFRSMRQRLV